MRTVILVSAITLALGSTAFAQMCGGGDTMQQQSGTTAQKGMSGMGGCMGMRQAQVKDDPMADKPGATPSKPMTGGGMMCPCCRNMASMGGMEPQGGEQPSGGTGQHKQPDMSPKQ
jgi:hypothetical protein